MRKRALIFLLGWMASIPSRAAVDLCQGLHVNDKANHPMAALNKPAVGTVLLDPEPAFGTGIKLRRITNAGAGNAIKTMYTTVPAWNADESLLLLRDVDRWDLALYDGKTYQFIRYLDDLNSAREVNAMWHASDPNILFFMEEGSKSLIRYNANAAAGSRRTVLRTFGDVCPNTLNGQSRTGYFDFGDDPVFNTWDSNYFSFVCQYDNGPNYEGSRVIVYKADTNEIIANKPGVVAWDGSVPKPARLGASGTLTLWNRSITDMRLDPFTPSRSIRIYNPDEHTSLGQLANGHDTFNTVVYDPPDNMLPGESDDDYVGSLTTYDLTTGSQTVIVGPKNGYLYPEDPHLSAVAHKNPGWVLISSNDDDDTVNNPPNGQELLDLELILANTNNGDVCRVGHHRSWGKPNQVVPDSYFAEAHGVLSPTGTRILFGSDWGGGNSIDTYVIELPTYNSTADNLAPARPRGLKVR